MARTAVLDRASDETVPAPITAAVEPQLGQILRTWLGFAAIGAGMIHLALVISAPLPIGVVLALLGLAEFAWGVFTFARDDLIVPRLARSVAVAPIIAWSLLVVAGTLLDEPAIAASLTLLPMATATAFELFVGAVLSVYLRRVEEAEENAAEGRADGVAGPRDPSAARYLVALTVGGLIVAALTTPALAGTEAGRFAQPHGDHDADFVPAQVDEDPLDGLLLPDHGH